MKQANVNEANVRVLQLKREFYSLSPKPNHTIFMDATAADELGISPETRRIRILIGGQVYRFRFVLFSLERPSGVIVRFTKKVLNRFKLEKGNTYPMVYNPCTNQLTIIRGLL